MVPCYARYPSDHSGSVLSLPIRSFFSAFARGPPPSFFRTDTLVVRQPGAPGHLEPVVQVAVSPNGKLIGSIAHGVKDDELKVWRVSDSSLLYQVPASSVRDGNEEAFAFSPDSSLIARTGQNDGKVHLLRAEQGTVLRSIDLRTGPDDRAADATSLAISPDGAYLVATGYTIAGGGGTLIRAFGTADGREIKGFAHPSEGWAVGVAFSKDGRLLAANLRVASPSGLSVSLYRSADRSLLWTSEPRSALPQGTPAFSPDGRWVATPDHDMGVRILDTSNGEIAKELIALRARGVAFSPAGDLLVAATETGLVTFSTKDWSLLRQVPGAFTSVAFSPDGRTVLVGGMDGTVRLVCSLMSSGF